MKSLFLLILTIIISIKAEFINYEEEGEISIITINRPKALNALNSEVLDELEKIRSTLRTYQPDQTPKLLISKYPNYTEEDFNNYMRFRNYIKEHNIKKLPIITNY